MIEVILKKAQRTHSLEKNEIIQLLKEPFYINCPLFCAADKVRKNYVGDDIHLRGLIEFSNYCKQNCHYCGLRKDNKNIKRYRLTEKEIINVAKNASEQGYKTIVLQSGEDLYYNVEKMIYIISEIKKFDVALTLSIGEKTYDEYEVYKKAGADRFLLRIETTDENLYENLDPEMNWNNRIKCLTDLKKLNFEVGTGCLVGLPDQTLESLADDILFFKKINADMIGIGPFLPNKDTPLGHLEKDNNNFELAIKVMAITRLLLPDINIPATTAMATFNKDGYKIALQSGANVIMPNITPDKYSKLYEIYPEKFSVDETPEKTLKTTLDIIQNIDRTVSKDYGCRKTNIRN